MAMSNRRFAEIKCWLLGLGVLLVSLCPAWGESKADTPESPVLGPQRLMPDQPFVGRFDEMRIRNYGFEEYPRQPPFTNSLKPHYSDLGDYLIFGSNMVNWRERRGLGITRSSSSMGGGSHGQAGNIGSLFNNVIVGTDATDDWRLAIIWADELRTKFTPLTFKMSNFDGLRVDWASKNNNFSGILSRGRYGSGGLKPPSMIMGGHFQRKVGFLNFGATYVNSHQYEPLMAADALTRQGVAAAVQNAPAMLAIRIGDDSPRDGRAGTVLHGIDVYINGELQTAIEPFIIRLDKRFDERQPYAQGLLRSGERKPLPPMANDYQSINRGALASTYDPYINWAAFDARLYYRGYEFPFWISHLYYRDFALYGQDYVINTDRPDEDPIIVHEEFAHELAQRTEDNPDGQFIALHTVSEPPAGSSATTLPQAFDGYEYGIIYVDIEPYAEWIESVNVDVWVSGDYHLELSELDIGGTQPNLPESDYKEKYRYASFFRTVARAEGNPAPQGQVKRVRVNAGTPTGVSLYSVNMHGVLKGFRINGEFARSNSFTQYVSGPPSVRVSTDALSINAIDREERPGARGTIGDNAYYLTVERDFERWAFAGEYFSMGPYYNTELRSFIGRDDGCCTGSLVTHNDALIYRLVEDNDDKDRFPDSWFTNHAIPNLFFLGQSDIDGIFPGLDEDQDGYPDQNRNFNGTPDYLEPFLMYDVDPQIYDYGPDMNHNDFLDHRENDWEPDYPYDPDLRGLHVYGSFKPAAGLNWTVGLMNAEQNAGAAPSDVLYTRLGYRRHVPSLGRFWSEASLEKVEDGVEDPLSVYSDRALTQAEQFALDFPGFQRNIRLAPFIEERREDELLFKNSTYLRLFTDARWWAVPGLNIRNKIKYEINYQNEDELFDGTRQEEDRRARWAMVHKIDYEWLLSDRLSCFFGFKFRYLKEWRKTLDLPTRHERNMIPLAQLKYRLTTKTHFQLGLQGIGMLLPYRVTDLADGSLDFDQRDVVLMMTNNSKYFGYIISTNLGVRQRVKEFAEPEVGEIENEDFVAAFINVILGFEFE